MLGISVCGARSAIDKYAAFRGKYSEKLIIRATYLIGEAKKKMLTFKIVGEAEIESTHARTHARTLEEVPALLASCSIM